ncbi:MAG: putative baseplate assembly protein [Gemmatimonadota bacterium]|jgi:predicted phage baseplate assembly protein
MPLEDLLVNELNLDDRTFESLVEEARRRIPGYTPEWHQWTDLNESDPGITLVQLFAWLTEMSLYRLNRVPERNYIKFLQLIGIQLDPPTPASTELTFTLTSKDLSNAVEIRQGTQVALSQSVDGQPVIFETDDNLYAVGAELLDIQTYDGATYRLVSEESRQPGQFFYPLSPRPQPGSALYLGFDRAFPDSPAPHRMRLHVYDRHLVEAGVGFRDEGPLSGEAEADVEVPLVEAESPPVVARWEYWAGSGRGWRALDVESDGTLSLTRTGYVSFRAPADHVPVKYGLLQADQDEARYWIRYRLIEELGSGYESAPRLESVYVNTVTATQAVTVTDELVGASDASPEQSFQLANSPVLPGQLDLEVDEGEGFVRWEGVRDFARSTRESRHYVLDPATGTIRFGNGEQGRIPRLLLPLDADGRPVPISGNVSGTGLPNILARRYRWGGGTRGNAGINTVNALRSSVPFVASVTNPVPAEGGADEESVEQAKRRAPSAIRNEGRAVTASDFEDLARRTPGARIRRARALPLHHPDYLPVRPATVGQPAVSLPVPGVVTVVVVPDVGTAASGVAEPARPMPSRDTLRRVAAWLRQHALVTSEVYAAAPRYRQVKVEAVVIAERTASSGDVSQALTRMLLRYFHPLTGGDAGDGWAFGGTIRFAEIFRRILQTPGVKEMAAEDLVLRIDGTVTKQRCEDVALGPDELVFSVDHAIQVRYA